jgi:Family of unknown function (DUF5906)/RepB DNA-primase from phage plasmid
MAAGWSCVADLVMAARVARGPRWPMPAQSRRRTAFAWSNNKGGTAMTGIPASITQTQKEALRARGLSDEEIATLQPEQAQKILNGGRALERDRAEAERFLEALDPTPGARFTFQTFDDNKKRRKERAEANKLRKKQGQRELNDPFAQIKHGTLARHWNELVKLNKAGAGIYVCVNETDGKGRKEGNVTRIRAGYADLDGAPLDPVNAAKLLPHIIIESSPGRFHAYWLIADDMPLDEFEALQKGLIAHFNSDPAIHDLPRVLRVPGFVHSKEGTPFLSRILQINEIGPYKWKDLREAFPAPEKPQHDPRAQSTGQDDLSDRWRDLNSEAIRRYSDWVPDVLPAATKTDTGYRVTSADLGRDFEEDLSFHAEGIKDFGVHDMGDSRGGSRTPIDIVEQYLHKNFNEAVSWLAQKLGHDPQGYLPKPKPRANGQGSGDAATDAEVARLAKLSAVQYDHERAAAAAKLNLRTATLDKLVADARAKQAYSKSQSEKSKQEAAAKTEAERLLAELNAENCVVLDGARTRVLRFEEVEHDVGGEHYVYRVPTFLRFEDFRNIYLNRHIMVGNRSVDVGSWWLQHAERRQYPGIIFKPAGEPIVNGKLNLWRGWGVTPRRGEWGLMREHVYEVLAARDDDVDAYTINWMAWAVQHPDEQAEVAIVFMGDRGTGRGTLGKVLCKIFGQHARHVSSPAHLTGRFNAHMRQCSFLFGDECYAPEDKGAEGQLKRLITEPTLQIEPKGRDVMEEPNRLHVMLASNSDWIVPAGAFERRYVVQEVADSHRQDPSWFDPIYEQLRSGGYEAMLFDLLERDLGNWHPRQIVRTAALAEQQEQSLSPLDAWWLELLQIGVLTGASETAPDRAVSNRYKEEVEESTDSGGTRTRTVYRDGLYDQARRISPKLKGETEAAFGRYLNNQGCERKWVRGHRGWQFPPLSVCRERWLERFPATVWLDPETKEWTCEDD